MGTKTNRHTRLALCVLFFVMAGQTYGDVVTLDGVDVTSSLPTTSDPVALTGYGWIGYINDIILLNSASQRSGAFIDLDFYFFDSNPGGVRLPIADRWDSSQNMGLLPEGTYYVNAQAWVQDRLADEFNSSFVVTPVTITVSGERHVPSEYPTIQAAIDASSNGDMVIIAPGTYTGDGNRDIDFKGKAITVKSENGPTNCIIDCQYSGRGFKFVSSEGRASILEGLTITSAYIVVMCEAGAGIYIKGASPTISKCVITNNHAELMSGSLCFCLGGGIYIGHDSDPLITNCIIRGNSVGDWGWGGGIYCELSSHATIYNCLISENTALGYEGRGGGIYCDSSSNLTVVNCTIVDNWAAQDGGGIHFDTYGSPIRNITNSITWGNSPDQIYAVDGTNILGTYSDVQGGWPGTGNINADPLFADPTNADYHLESQAGRWDPNTQSWVQDANTSPCIDAGDPNSDWTEELWPNGKRINMGAYGGTPEASMSLSTVGNIANLDNDPCDIADLYDLKIFVEKWCFEENLLAEDLDRNGRVDFNDFAIFGNEYYETYSGEPEISYTITPCEQGASQIASAAQTGQTRFTVTVEGHYIRFEDMMVANCCAQQLWLEMDITDNLIIIYEHWFAMYPCYCICDYPVDATLGPFRSGTYTLEVYEDYGGFIGSTAVIIE